MENLSKFINEIKKFYALVELHESDFQNFLNEAKKPLRSVTNQSVFYRAAAQENSMLNTAFEHVEGFRAALVENIFISLEEEYNLLIAIRNKINLANEKIQKEQLFLENLFEGFKSEGSINFDNLNPCCPALEHIIGWSHDIWCYYHSYYLQISQALLKLNYESENSVENLTECFKEDIELKNKINKGRSFKFLEFEFVV